MDDRLTLDIMKTLLRLPIYLALILASGCSEKHPAETEAIKMVRERMADAKIQSVRSNILSDHRVVIEVDYWRTPATAFPQKRSLWMDRMMFDFTAEGWQCVELLGGYAKE